MLWRENPCQMHAHFGVYVAHSSKTISLGLYPITKVVRPILIMPIHHHISCIGMSTLFHIFSFVEKKETILYAYRKLKFKNNKDPNLICRCHTIYPFNKEDTGWS
ncbi:hypothetical protein EUGRSUZ_K02238 [Eucalyptus grandis]|uniref:Uncharacterized protein n=2 Tax=Eucalyptus grandis TaxID=71139 RepID=A0ACC3IXB4_EUCGR|nr:hypothetical protein EUGRSUZ_K02238 [Eucalyptus grandis]